MNRKNNIKVTVTIDRDVEAKIRELSFADNRSVSNYVETILKKEIAKHEEKSE